jgi:CRISPR type III-B/RAMP module-associated protein Cmr5
VADSLDRVDLHTAREAAGILDAILASGDAISGELLARLMGLPVMLRISGLPGTLAFFAAKSGTDRPGQAYGDVSSALQTTVARCLTEQGPTTGTIALVNRLAQAPIDEQAAASATVESLAIWLRRLAEATEKEQARARAAAGGAREPAPVAERDTGDAK